MCESFSAARHAARCLVIMMLTFATAASLSMAIFVGPSAFAQVPALRVSADARRLETTSGQPFFWLGDMAWKIYRLTPAELDTYFAIRKQQGFNVIQGPVLFNDGPNYAGATNTNPGSPSEAWFSHIDTIIDKAAGHGLYVVPVLLWSDSVSMFNSTTMYEFGRYVGQRYRNRTNIAAFFVGGEFNHPSPNTTLWNQAALGLQAGLAGTPRLISALPRWYGTSGGQSTGYDLHGFGWLSFNAVQSSQYGNCTNSSSNNFYLGTHNWKLVENDWNRTPIKPVLDAEATLEWVDPRNPSCPMNPSRWDAFGVRRRAYWSVFAGGFGHTYGANGVYQFHKSSWPMTEFNPAHTWDVAIDYEGAHDMIHLRRLMESRPLTTRRPGQDMLISPIDDNVPTHVHMTRDASGGFAMAYVPGASRTITIDMDFIGGTTHKFWWFDPRTGQATLSRSFSRSQYGSGGSFSRTTPGSGEDWVLVIDDAARGFAAPGTGSGGGSPGGAGDTNGDGAVNVNDLLDVVNGWGWCGGCPADLNDSGAVDVMDLLEVINGWH